MSNNDDSAPQKKQRRSKAGYRPSREESGKIRIEWFAPSHPMGMRVDRWLRSKTHVQMMKNILLESARHRYRNRESGLPSV
jgi:hypothetical protein